MPVRQMGECGSIGLNMQIFKITMLTIFLLGPGGSSQSTIHTSLVAKSIVKVDVKRSLLFTYALMRFQMKRRVFIGVSGILQKTNNKVASLTKINHRLSCRCCARVRRTIPKDIVTFPL